MSARSLIHLIITLLLFSRLTPTVFAGTDPIDRTATVSATVPTAPPSSANLAPTSPILLRPADNTTTSDNVPELVWRLSTDPDGNTITYTLYLDGIATYLGISGLGSSSGTNYTAYLEGNEIRLLPTTPLAEGLHTWYVRAYDVNNLSSSSTIWSFTVDNTPPFILISDIDTHHHLTLDSRLEGSINKDTIFELRGPKDIYFTIHTEPYSSVELKIYTEDNQLLYHEHGKATHEGLYYPYTHLRKGRYWVEVLATDPSNLSTILPSFSLLVTEVSLPLPALSPLPLPPQLIIPPLPGLPPSYSATISLIASRGYLAIYIFSLIAIGIIALIIFLKKRRYNLLLLDYSGVPLPHATVYHSHPDSSKSQLSGKLVLHTPVLLTHRPPLKHVLVPSDDGKLYLPGLSRLSTLTIRTKNTLTIISIARFHSPLILTIS